MPRSFYAFCDAAIIRYVDKESLWLALFGTERFCMLEPLCHP